MRTLHLEHARVHRRHQINESPAHRDARSGGRAPVGDVGRRAAVAGARLPLINLSEIPGPALVIYIGSIWVHIWV